MRTTIDERRRIEALEPADLEKRQLGRLNALLQAILPQNHFYAHKLAAHLDMKQLASGAGPLASLDELSTLPFTFKEELLGNTAQGRRDPGEAAVNSTFSRERYIRFHRTSGTHGRPLPVFDTADDWEWWIDCWQYVLDAAGVQPGDCVMTAFSFGPFIGFWSAYDAASRRGCLVVPGGGMNTLARLELLATTAATAVFSTPTYALHMAEVASQRGIDLGGLAVRRLILAGEPGGSVPETRSRIESAWQATVLDHAGATEVGPWGYGDAEGRGLYVLESEFIAEFLSVETGQLAAQGELAELVLTTLGRVGGPVIRYRTGDLVRPNWQREGANRFVFLDGGVLARTDDMLVIRGVNIFPSSLEQILRSFPEVMEYRAIVRKEAEMDQLLIEIEDRLDEPARVAAELELRLGLKVPVRTVPLGSLPRFEGKGSRLIDERGA